MNAKHEQLRWIVCCVEYRHRHHMTSDSLRSSVDDVTLVKILSALENSSGKSFDGVGERFSNANISEYFSFHIADESFTTTSHVLAYYDPLEA